MARRTRSFLFDNISKRLVQNTNKTAKEINTRVSANTTANTDILTKAEVQTVISNTSIATLSDTTVANVANEQVLQYNANTGKWENETLSLVSSVDGLTDTNLTSLSNGDYLVYSSAGSEWINRSLDLSGYVTDTEIADYSNTAQMNTAIAASNTLMTTYVDNQVANVDFSAYSTTTQMNTAIASSNTAMKNYVDAEVAGIVNSAPAALDTLNELAAALGDDANFSTTTSTALGNRLRIDVSNQSLTGTQQTNALTNLGITATVAELNKLDGVTATTAELNYVDGVTSNIQTQLNAKGTSSFSGAYADLTGKPSLFSGAYADLTGKPSLFSGAYADLSGKPTIPTNNNQLTNGAGYITNSGGTEAATASTVAKRNGSADINARLFRSSYQNQSTISGGIAYRVNTTDNYIRFCNDAAAIRTFIGAGTSSFSGSYNDLSNKPTIPTNNNQLTNGAGYTTFTANQSLDTTSNVTHAQIHATNWFRNDSAGEGLYNTATAQHFHSASSAYWHINSSNGLIFYSAYNATAGNATNRKGYVYFDGSGFGLLHSGGGWAVRTTSTDTVLYGSVQLGSTISEAPSEWNPVLLEDGGIIKKDSSVTIHGAGYLSAAYLNMSHGVGNRTDDTVFYSSYDNYIRKNDKAGMQGSLGIGGGAVYVDVSTANYGTIKVDDDRGVSWAGYTIRDDWSLMSNGATTFGIYNDTDNEWMLQCVRNGATNLRYNGSTKLDTDASGITVTGRIDCTSQTAYVARNYGHGIFGVYSATRHQHVWSMGTAYNLTADGTGVGDLYGLSWTHTNIGSAAASGLSHQLNVRANGSLWSAIGYGIWTIGNVCAYSDIAVKENIVKIDNALDKVKQINGYTFDRIDAKEWNEDKEDNVPIRQAGVIAQEIEKVLPEVVQGEEGNKSVSYGNVVALLIEAIKEQQEQIEELKERLQ